MSTQVREVVQLVNGHINEHPTDSVSAAKVLSTVATFAYKNDIPKEVIKHQQHQQDINVASDGKLMRHQRHFLTNTGECRVDGELVQLCHHLGQEQDEHQGELFLPLSRDEALGRAGAAGQVCSGYLNKFVFLPNTFYGCV